jgi:hypothetical protein
MLAPNGHNMTARSSSGSFSLSCASLNSFKPAERPGAATKVALGFSFGGQRGSTVQVEVRGNFEKTYAAWFESGQFEVRLKVEEIKNQAEQVQL